MSFKRTEKQHPTFSHFFRPFIILGIMVLIGVLFYTKVEGWDFLDALFMSVETLTTVGFGLSHPLSITGKIFTIAYIVFGVLMFLYIATEFAEFIFLARFDKTFMRRTMENKIKKLKNHYIVCGYGRTGMEIASQLSAGNFDYVVIDKNTEIEPLIKEKETLYLVGDATDDSVLEKAGVTKAKGIFCSLSDDVDNLYLTVSSKNLNPEIAIITRCVKVSNEQKFKKAGATTIILPYEISAKRMVASVVKPLVVDFLDVVTHIKGQELELKLEQFMLKSGSKLENKTIITSKIREKTGIIIVALKRNGKFITNPSPDTVLKADDYLITLGTTQQLTNFEKLTKLLGE